MVSKQNPVITTVGCPKTTMCGGMDWQVNFSLAASATTCGWIIQQVTTDSPTDGHDQFWEAFYIKAGATTTMNLYKPADDTYGSSHALNTSGTETVKGIARFYEGTLPSDFVYCDQDGGSPAGGTRRFTRKEPSWWDGQGTPHTITIEWNCTGMSTTCSVQTDPPNGCPSTCP